MKTCDLVIIGGGPAGLAAALGARKQGIKDILIVERDKELGGILNQCIHNGFGLHTFKEELTGPEYAGRYIEQVKDAGIPYVVDSMVLSIQSMSQYKSSLQADQCEYNKEKYSEADQDKYSKKKDTDKIITMVLFVIITSSMIFMINEFKTINNRITYFHFSTFSFTLVCRKHYFRKFSNNP